ncbi:exopolysaccharide biosynthesis polyprenyl glycosylphosphotransferase [Polaribacter aestuariivivens]|uniref:exopolysaccharide biosynthesis polyprenyl glycosylphosphotransferase n=1 Tax=Polaribacter aestuariivivens TaxID=2304626 RepID=UPI001FE80916|nr:exopolysaccharide biosynthesis polyprenyl glycosylphosphotransferase [Polaribacter aestuariivivens]
MIKKIKKYSSLIRPLIIFFDVLIVNAVVYYFSEKSSFNIQLSAYLTLFWLLISYYTKFYNVYRYTHVLRLLTLLISQFFVFLLSFFAYFTLFKEGEIVSKQSNIVFFFIVIITFLKFLFFFLLKYYRQSGKNYRNVVVFGQSKSAQNVAEMFNKQQGLGYRFQGFFSDRTSNLKNYKGTIKDGLEFIKKNEIEEVYCEESSITRQKLLEVRTFCNQYKIKFSLIPETKAIYSKDFILEHYGTLPILKPKQLPFERVETHLIKRSFDIVFSLIICVLLLSWLLPILWVIVKFNSRGSFFFKQKRDGINGKQFYCYKIRSMKKNDLADRKSTTKNDDRITSVGAFLRKTSLDELPQFFNVLLGDMSIVGPRPHMNFQTKKYLIEIDNYLLRNSVKPGITGLAQVSGYRGEVKQKSDIENRVRLDVFYIENWSFFLDLKIIVQTVLSVFKGEEKAY